MLMSFVVPPKPPDVHLHEHEGKGFRTSLESFNQEEFVRKVNKFLLLEGIC